MKAYLCCIGRLENRYIRDFVSYYKNLGFDKVILCDNNRDGEERFEDVINDYISDGFVVVENYRDEDYAQIYAYVKCYSKYEKECDWMAFFDIDEFLTLPKNKTIQEYLSQDKFNDFSAIHINWMTYGDCGKTRYEDKPVYERFLDPIPYDTFGINNIRMNSLVKTILRSGTEFNLSEIPNPHTPTTIYGRVCNEHGEEIENKVTNDNYDYSEAFLKHFTTKTAEEYVKKIGTGCPDMARSTVSFYNQFFNINEYTEEKAGILKSGVYSNNKLFDITVEIVYAATGDYIKYLEGFLSSIKYFLPTVKKKIKILTNREIVIQKYPTDVIDIEIIKMFDLFYPCINLHKTYFIQQMKHDGVDAIFYFDADTVFLDVPEYDWETFLATIINDGYFSISLHPFYALSDSDKYKQRDINNFFTGMTERDPNSSAFISEKTYSYVISSFFAARTDVMLNICKKVNEMILEDMTRRKGYHIPLYIDENYFNKIVYNCEYNIERIFNVKVGMFIKLGNAESDTYREIFLMQKNINKEFKTSRR